MKLKSNTSGISIISLIITIVILLILAGLSIIQLTGNNNLFIRAKQAKNNTIEMQNAENTILSSYETEIGKYVDNSRDTNSNSENYTILFEGSLEAKETKTLNDDINKYKKLEIRYKWSSNYFGSINTFLDYDFKNPSNKLAVGQNSDNTYYFICKYVYFPTGNTITCNSSYVGGYTDISMTIFGFKTY